MLIFLYGEDTFRLARKLNQIIEEYKKHSRGLDFSVFDCQTGEIADFFAGVRQNSLFQEKKFFVVKNPILNKEFKESLIDNLEMAVKSGHNIVFCQEGKVLKADRLLSAFKKIAEIQEFVPLEDVKLAAWAAKEFSDLGNPVSLPVAQAFARRIGNDLWRAENEIQKLAHRITGRQITVADVERNVSPEVEANIFKTIDAVAARDKKQAIRLVKEHIEKGDHPLYLLAMIASQFKNLLLVKSSDGLGGAARLGMHPYVFGKTMQQSRRFTFDEVKSIYQKIVLADFEIKTGKVSPDAGIDLLIANI